MNLHDMINTVENLLHSRNGNWLDTELQHRLTEVRNQAIVFIKKYPVGSLLTVAVAGFIIGKILKK